MFSRRTTTIVTVVLVALVTVALVVSAVPVFARPAAALPAHAELVSTTPKDGATVRSVQSVSFTFSEDVNEKFLKVTVTGPDGDETDGSPQVDGGTVTQPVVAQLPPGEHTVTYRVVSVDGHPVSGDFTFTTTASPASASPSATPSDSPSPTMSSASPTPSLTPSATPSADTSPTSSSGTPGWVLPVALVVLVLVVGAVAVLLSRRRGSHGPGARGGSA